MAAVERFEATFQGPLHRGRLEFIENRDAMRRQKRVGVHEVLNDETLVFKLLLHGANEDAKCRTHRGASAREINFLKQKCLIGGGINFHVLLHRLRIGYRRAGDSRAAGSDLTGYRNFAKSLL